MFAYRSSALENIEEKHCRAHQLSKPVEPWNPGWFFWSLGETTKLNNWARLNWSVWWPRLGHLIVERTKWFSIFSKISCFADRLPFMINKLVSDTWRTLFYRKFKRFPAAPRARILFGNCNGFSFIYTAEVYCKSMREKQDPQILMFANCSDPLMYC